MTPPCARPVAGARRLPVPFELRQNVHWCDCAGRAVFLDVEADRYFCLPAEANCAFLRLAAGTPEPTDTERLQPLVSRGILIEADTTGAFGQPPLIDAADGDLTGRPHGPPRPLAVIRELLAEMLMARRLRTKTFSEVIETIQRQGSMDRRAPRNLPRTLHSIAAASTTASYLTRIQDRCLVRALAVHSICLRYGIRPKLVFGVIAHPFAAHCWVQHGSKVLVGGFDQARLYTPIMVVE